MNLEKNRSYFFVVISAVAALSGILFGFDTGVISGAILFINDEFHLTPFLNGFVVSAVLGGALLGAMISGRVVDRLGRKKLLIIDVFIFMLGTLISSITSSIILLVFGRISVGIAIGIASYVAPLYISEIAPTHYRGALVSLNQLAITVGILLSYLVDYLCVNHGGWRFMFAAGLVPAMGLLIGMFFLPESPRWIYGTGQKDHALAILKKIHGAQKSQKEYQVIQQNFDQQQGTWKMLFDPFMRTSLIVGAGLAVIQQITGINTLIYYAPTIFNFAGFVGANNAILATSAIGIVFVISTIIALPLIDSWGRRPLLLFGLVGMMLSLAFLGFVFSGLHASPLLKWIALGSMLIYIACFGISLGPIMWLMIAELFPLKIRGLGGSVATAVNWGSNMLVAFSFLMLIQWLGIGNTFFLYSFFSAMSILFVFYLVPETKAVTLEQIESNLRSGLTYRKIGLQKSLLITEQ